MLMLRLILRIVHLLCGLEPEKIGVLTQRQSNIFFSSMQCKNLVFKSPRRGCVPRRCENQGQVWVVDLTLRWWYVSFLPQAGLSKYQICAAHLAEACDIRLSSVLEIIQVHQTILGILGRNSANIQSVSVTLSKRVKSLVSDLSGWSGGWCLGVRMFFWPGIRNVFSVEVENMHWCRDCGPDQ